MIVRPENARSPLVAWIALDQERSVITTLFPERHERFVDVVRGMDYVWSDQHRRWQRRIQPVFHGSLDDRAAELGSELLLSGFVVDFPDDSLAQRAIAAEYVPEQRLWVKKLIDGPYRGWFSIHWPRSADYYQQARRLPGSRYSKPHVVVPTDAFADVLDFAEQHGFSLSPGAGRLVDEARARYEASVLAVSSPRPTAAQQPAAPAHVNAIDQDLADDDDLDDDD
jgi:hypothetical protein